MLQYGNLCKGHVLAKYRLAPALCKPLFSLKKRKIHWYLISFFINENFGVLRMWPASDEECYDDECDH